MATKNNKKDGKPTKVAGEKIDYSKDPFFIKKNERAAEVIKKHGIPDHFLKKLN